MKFACFAPMAALVACAAACSPSSPDHPADKSVTTAATESAKSQPDPVSQPRAAQVFKVDDWVGRWNGPEGLFVRVYSGEATNTVRLQLKDNLDSETVYSGVLTADGISFTRAGRMELIRRGTGAETGFSALRGRTDCLIVRRGVEGYCRPSEPSPDAAPTASDASLPLTRGVYVLSSMSCADPAFAGVRTFDGRGLASAHSRECRATVVASSGSVYTVDNDCIDAGAGPAPRSTERLVIAISDPAKFALRSGPVRTIIGCVLATSYRRACAKPHNFGVAAATR